jgi:hypothetical protein
MAVNKLTPRYLNKDDDSRLVKSTEMTDALNVRISSDDDGDALVVKNAYGNEEVTLATALPAGTNKVIGSTANEQSGSIYYFVWNSNDNHSIYRYSVGSNQSKLVYRDSVLAFNENGFVKGNVVTSIDGDELLYFNDSVNSPKKINASKALRAGYPDALTNGTDEEKLLCLTVAKQPPLDPPAYNIVNNPDLGENRIADKVFQFAYRYIYEDGEVSALSPYSSLTTSVAQLRDGFNTQSAKEFYNQVNVFVKNSVADVEKIQLFAREGNEGTFYQVKELTNNENAATATVAFTNSSVGEALSVTDKNKLYDNVPQLADSQEIASGRLMYGGYTEGYPNVDIDVELIDNYKEGPTIYNVGASLNTDGRTVSLDFSSLPASASVNSKVFINFFIDTNQITINGSGGTSFAFTGVGVSYYENDATNNFAYDVFTLDAVADATTNGANFDSSGIQIQEYVDVPSGQTRQQIIDAVNARLDAIVYSVALRKPVDSDSIMDFNGAGNTGNLKGVMEFSAFITHITGTTASSVEFRPITAELQVQEYYKSDVRMNIALSDPIIVNLSTYEVSTSSSQLNVGSFFLSDLGVETKTFKSGSSHKMGIVYYDDRNRSGGVQELGDIYIKSLNNRTAENDLYGAASVVMRLPDSAPDWARRWAPVYVGKGNIDSKFIYGVGGAFAPYRTDDASNLFSSPELIYVSINTLLGKNNSYKVSAGSLIDYTFEEGDKLRVISYEGGYETAEFNVVGYKTLINDETNPILDTSSTASIESTTGEFLLIEENPEATNFTLSKINNRSSKWFEKCVVEVYNRKKEKEDNIYYEVGKSYEVVNGVHSDERTNTTLDITVTSSSSGLLFGTSEHKLFKGDNLTVGSNVISIGNTYVASGVNYFYATDKSITPLAVGSYNNATVNNPDKVIDLSLGDAYFRPRAIFTTNGQLAASNYRIYLRQTTIVKYIDDYSVSDFFVSKGTSIGRSIAYIPDAKTVKRSGSITYSEPYLQEGTFNGLSSFNLSLANFKDLAYEHGSIKGLISYNERMYFVQENRSGVLAVNRQVIDTGSGDNLITLSKNVLQSEQYYVGEYGTNNPESIASRDGMVYFADVKRGKVLRIDSQGLSIISDVNMSSYFDDKFGIISKYQPSTVIGGVDKDNDEYIISSDTITEASIAINTDEYVYTAQLDSSGTQVLADTVYNPSAVFTFSSEVRTFNDICDEFQDSLGAIVYLDDLADGGVVYVDLPYQVSNLYGVATNKTYDFFVSINVNMFLPGFVFDNGYCNSDDVGSINPASSVLDAFTVAYGTDARVWNTRYSYTPESIVSVHNDLFSFKSGKIYKHSEAASRNTFYGAATAESIVEAVSNAAPSAIKTFESLSLEGDAAWDATVTTTNQTAVIDDTSFKEKEGFYYAYIHGDTSSYGSQIESVTSTSEIFSLGVVASVDGSAVTFSNAVNTISFPAGSTATLYKVNAAQNRLDTLGVYPLSVTGQKAITFSGAVSATAGDLLVVVGNSAIEGDQIRDYFAKIKLTKTTSAPIELFAINATFADSKLHN